MSSMIASQSSTGAEHAGMARPILVAGSGWDALRYVHNLSDAETIRSKSRRAPIGAVIEGAEMTVSQRTLAAFGQDGYMLVSCSAIGSGSRRW